MIKDEQKQSCHPEVAEPRQYGSHQELSVVAKEVPEPRQYRSKRAAFTLAEVLITLGIIGVVAAMTIPTLAKNIQHKILEVKFKKSLTTLQLIITNTRVHTDSYSVYTYCSDNGPNACTSALTEQILLLSDSKQCRAGSYVKCSVERNSGDIISFNGKSKLNNKGIIFMFPFYYMLNLRDGSYVGIYKHSSKAPYFVIDVNGNENPNRLGHDIFAFTINSKDKLVVLYTPNNSMTDEQAEQAYSANHNNRTYYVSIAGNPCNLTSNRGGNGLGCTYYALQNKCPWDSSKTYWECLP